MEAEGMVIDSRCGNRSTGNHRSIRELSELFATPQRYALEVIIDGVKRHITIGASDVVCFRSRGYLDLMTTRIDGVRELITIPTSVESLERCRLVEYQTPRFDSTLFAPYRLCSACVIDQKSVTRQSIIEVAIQRLPSGRLLSDVLKEVEEQRVEAKVTEAQKIKKIYCAIDLLERTTHEMKVCFKDLIPSNIILGDDGRLYPFRYDTLRFRRTGSVEALRASVAEANRAMIETTYEIEPYPKFNHDPYGGYLWCDTPHEDRVAVMDVTGYGFIDEAGSVVVQPSYISVERFREGRAIVRSSRGWGLIDVWGDEVIPSENEGVDYDEVSGISAVKRNGMWSYFSYTGQQLTPFTAEYPREFHPR